MLKDIALALWFFVPAGVANMTPIFAARLPVLRRWNAPLDGGLTFRGRRLLGANKTWRGLVAGIVTATLTLWLQQAVTPHAHWLAALVSPLRYGSLPVLLLGPLFAIGALGGDAIESFFKRQRHLPPGKPWHPYDELDTIIGSCIATAPVAMLSATQYIAALLLFPALQFLISTAGYWLGIKARPI